MGNGRASCSGFPQSPFLWVSRTILVCAVTTSYVIAIGNIGLNSDLFLGFAAGKRVLQEGLAAPCTWSFTNPGALWVDQSWLSHLIYYIAYANLGCAGPVLVKILLLLACSVFLFYRCRRLTGNTDASLASLYLGLLAAGPFLTIRAENFGVLYLLVLTSLLSDTFWPALVRRLGIFLVIAVWCNSHGSFILGLALIISKLCLVTFREGLGLLPFSCGGDRRLRIVEWGLITAGSIAVSACVSPFGLGNLVMPFVQMGTKIVTSHSIDWLPILSLSNAEVRFIGTGSPFPFTILLILIFFAFLFMVDKYRKNQGKKPKYGSPIESRSEAATSGSSIRKILRAIPCDLVTETVLFLALVILAFKHRRFILFSALASVPVASILLTVMIESKLMGRKHWPRMNHRVIGAGSTAVSALVLAASFWVFFVTVALPYAPNNPLRPDRPVIRDLMSYDTFSSELVSFIYENKLKGRTLAGWELSSYLLYHAPQLNIFMDTRDQSFYPVNIIEDYFAVMGVGRQPDSEPLDIPDTYGVSIVVLTTYPYDFDLGIKLLKSGKWGCVFSDDYSMLLVRRDNPEFSQAIGSTNYSGLQYSNEGTRIRSEAMQSHFGSLHVLPILGQKLEQLVLLRPWPNYYRLICWAIDDPGSCLRVDTERFLTGEMTRLISKGPYYRHGAEEVTASLIVLSEIMQDNAFHCGRLKQAKHFERVKKVFQEQYESLRHKYSGYF
jgi:hypothetical protein